MSRKRTLIMARNINLSFKDLSKLTGIEENTIKQVFDTKQILEEEFCTIKNMVEEIYAPAFKLKEKFLKIN